MVKKKGTVEKERVVCQNCRYQYAFLYEAKKQAESSVPSLTGALKNYVNGRECFRACPHCGNYQDWMVTARRKHLMLDLFLVCLVGACGVLMYLIYQMLTVALDPLATGSFQSLDRAQTVLLGYLGFITLLASGYLGYLRWFWNPNQDVDTQSYEATVPQKLVPKDVVSAVSQFEAATRVAAEVELPPQDRSFGKLSWSSISWTKRCFIGTGLLIGIASLMAPAMSPDLAFALANKGMTMLPFYFGVVFLIASALGGSWQFLDEKLR